RRKPLFRAPARDDIHLQNSQRRLDLEEVSMATATMVFHILAGSLSLVAGFVALYAAKGAPLHRKAGMFFVVVMLTMTTTGAVIAATRGTAAEMNIPAALITAYLVVTALTTIRPPTTGARWLTAGLMLLALSIGLFTLTLGF